MKKENRVLHEAGPVKGDRQFCARCGAVVIESLLAIVDLRGYKRGGAICLTDDGSYLDESVTPNCNATRGGE